jgi:hypothetical protein
VVRIHSGVPPSSNQFNNLAQDGSLGFLAGPIVFGRFLDDSDLQLTRMGGCGQTIDRGNHTDGRRFYNLHARLSSAAPTFFLPPRLGAPLGTAIGAVSDNSASVGGWL